VDPTSLRVVASLPERDLFRVQLGQRASLRSSYDASVEVQGEIVRMAPVVDPNTGTFRVTVGLDPDQTALRPGQFVSVSLEVSNVADALLVDRHAVGYELGQPFVYVLETPEPKDEAEASDDAEEPSAAKAHYVAKRRYFAAGLMDSDHVEVTEGLTEGEAFVSVGQNLLREGSLVRTSDADE
jgi:membrane fusion protein (multidrug efflux system)